GRPDPRRGGPARRQPTESDRLAPRLLESRLPAPRRARPAPHGQGRLPLEADLMRPCHLGRLSPPPRWWGGGDGGLGGRSRMSDRPAPIFLGYDRAGLDREYNNRAKVAAFADYLARYTRESEATRRSLPCRLDLAYGGKPGETLDVFPAPGGGPAPIHAFIHGGSWMAL